MSNEKLLSELDKPLEKSRIKLRKGRGNKQFAYLPGWDILQKLNSLFGHLNWSGEILEIKHVGSSISDKDGKTLHIESYLCHYKLRIAPGSDASVEFSREDVGFGSGVNAVQEEAHDGACKSAVTDAIRRCARTLGNQFGLSLYDTDSTSQSNGSGRSAASRQSSGSTESSDLCTEKQRSSIERFCKEVKVNAPTAFAFFSDWLNIEPITALADLTKDEASQILEQIFDAEKKKGFVAQIKDSQG